MLRSCQMNPECPVPQHDVIPPNAVSSSALLTWLTVRPSNPGLPLPVQSQHMNNKVSASANKCGSVFWSQKA